MRSSAPGFWIPLSLPGGVCYSRNGSDDKGSERVHLHGGLCLLHRNYKANRQQLIRWESLKSISHKWETEFCANSSINGKVPAYGGPRQHPDIRQSGPVREHQPGSPLVGNADLDGEPAVIDAGIEARRVPPEAHNATGDPNRAGT